MTQIATPIFVLGILGLFLLDRDFKVRTSSALWIPIIWTLIAASRPVSMWLNYAPAQSAEEVMDGSPVDRNVFLVLLVLGVGVILKRKPRVRKLLRGNAPLLGFFIYCSISVVWSEYPLVASKRLIKFIGDLVMVLIVLTDRDPREAFDRFLARLSFILIPISILLIKYYPDIGRGYDRWTYKPIYIGVTYNKNLLGMVCLILGVSMGWRFIKALRGENGIRQKGPAIACGVIVAMVLWLLSIAHSATSQSCFYMGIVVVILASIRGVARRPVIVHLTALTMVSVAFAALFLDLGSGLVETLGRDSTLTGRTELWQRIMGMNGNVLLGRGFDSFWLGERLAALWKIYWWQPNEAHNGYIEVFLNLGLVGVGFLIALIGKGYRQAADGIRRGRIEGGVMLAYVVIAIAYNFTEAAFKMLSPIWLFFLLAVLGIPKRAVQAGSVRVSQGEATPLLATASRWDLEGA